MRGVADEVQAGGQAIGADVERIWRLREEYELEVRALAARRPRRRVGPATPTRQGSR